MEGGREDGWMDGGRDGERGVSVRVCTYVCSNRRHKASKSYVIQCKGVPRAHVKLYVQISMTQSSAVDHTRHYARYYIRMYHISSVHTSTAILCICIHVRSWLGVQCREYREQCEVHKHSSSSLTDPPAAVQATHHHRRWSQCLN